MIKQLRRILTALVLVLVLTTTAACNGAVQAKSPTLTPPSSSSNYGQLERGNSAGGQEFGNWVVSKSKGLVKDAYVRDNNKLGVIVTP